MKIHGVKSDGSLIPLVGRPDAIIHAWKSLYGLPVKVNDSLQEPNNKVSYHSNLWISVTASERLQVYLLLKERFKSYVNIDYKAWQPNFNTYITARLRGNIISVATVTSESLIENLATKMMHEQKGHARQIVRHAIKSCDGKHTICLRVSKEHDRSHFLHSFYASLHFHLTHQTIQYYNYTYPKELLLNK